MLTVVDEYTRECLAIQVARRLSSQEVLAVMIGEVDTPPSPPRRLVASSVVSYQQSRKGGLRFPSSPDTSSRGINQRPHPDVCWGQKRQPIRGPLGQHAPSTQEADPSVRVAGEMPTTTSAGAWRGGYVAGGNWLVVFWSHLCPLPLSGFHLFQMPRVSLLVCPNPSELERSRHPTVLPEAALFLRIALPGTALRHLRLRFIRGEL
jgi:hypothetical protein